MPMITYQVTALDGGDGGLDLKALLRLCDSCYEGA